MPLALLDVDAGAVDVPPSGLFGWLKEILSDFNRTGTSFLEVCFPEVRHLLLLGDPQRTAIFGPPSTDAGS